MTIETKSLVPDSSVSRENPYRRNAKADAIVSHHFAGMSTDNNRGKQGREGKENGKYKEFS